jgi:hypothetical protein
VDVRLLGGPKEQFLVVRTPVWDRPGQAGRRELRNHYRRVHSPESTRDNVDGIPSPAEVELKSVRLIEDDNDRMSEMTTFSGTQHQTIATISGGDVSQQRPWEPQ